MSLIKNEEKMKDDRFYAHNNYIKKNKKHIEGDTDCTVEERTHRTQGGVHTLP